MVQSTQGVRTIADQGSCDCCRVRPFRWRVAAGDDLVKLDWHSRSVDEGAHGRLKPASVRKAGRSLEQVAQIDDRRLGLCGRRWPARPLVPCHRDGRCGAGEVQLVRRRADFGRRSSLPDVATFASARTSHVEVVQCYPHRNTEEARWAVSIPALSVQASDG